MWKAMLVACSVLLLAASASAQYGRRQGGPIALVDRCLSDLDNARYHPSKAEWANDARRDLLRFREHLREGRFDKDRLDGAIENLNRLAHSDGVAPRSRRVFQRDVEDLRDLRARSHDRYRY